MKKLALAFMVTGSAAVMAQAQYDEGYFTVHSKTVYEVTTINTKEQLKVVSKQKFNPPQGVPEGGSAPVGASFGKVINMGKDLVALGEDVYRLVSKGKPSNKLDYAPISIVPKVEGKAIDIFETEGWSFAPLKRTYGVSYTNLYGMTVVDFRYTVLFSYGGHYNGKGAYITAAQVIPESVSTLFGYDFTATMKLGGIQNHGTKDDPIAGATLLLEHTVSTIIKAGVETDTFHITGTGNYKKI
jgi:hypothetical protein